MFLFYLLNSILTTLVIFEFGSLTVVIVVPDLKIHNLKSAIYTYLGDTDDTEDVVDDMSSLGVVEPTIVKIQAIKSSTEATSMILRIDDVIASAKSAGMPPGGMPPGMGGGMGGMPPGMGGMGMPPMDY